jgi:2-polyprenyl-3-methyl-5-hydroxy-6-metoxy-1,4-benzoquinol methylase
MVVRLLHQCFGDTGADVLDIGCGNGHLAGQLAALGHRVTGVDVARDGIEIARRTYPHLRFEAMSIYDPRLETIVVPNVTCVLAIEVLEHLFYPRRLFEVGRLLLPRGGVMIVSTPYHGYLKNLATSVVNRWDQHFTVDVEGGHIKFFSRRTLTTMASDEGFEVRGFRGVGRIPVFWKSMVVLLERM